MNLTKAFWRLLEKADELLGLPGEVRRLWIENDLIRARLDALEVAKEPTTVTVTWPGMPDFLASTDYCSQGGLHEYPQVWHAVTPAPCVKCGLAPVPPYVTKCGGTSY